MVEAGAVLVVAAAAVAAAAGKERAMATVLKVWKRKMLFKWNFKDLSCGRDSMTSGLR